MAFFNAHGYPIIIEEVINRKRTLRSFTNQKPFDESEASSTIKKNVPKDDKFGLGDEQHDHINTFQKEVIDRKRTLRSFTNQKPFDKSEASSTIKKNVPEDDKFGLGDEQHDHIKETVLGGKSKNVKTYGKKRIKHQKTPNKLTTKTPLEPGTSSAIKNNVPDDDNFLDELDETDHKIHFYCKPRKPDPPPFRLQPLKNFFDHDHNYCIAANFGFSYGDLIPGRYSRHFDPEAMVPIKSSVHSSDSSDSSHSCLFDEPLVFPSLSPSDGSPSPPSDGPPSSPSDEKLLAMESNPDGKLGEYFKELDDLFGL